MSYQTRSQQPVPSVWPAFERLFGFRNELDRLFEPFAELTRGSQLLRVWNPAIDLYEDKESLIVKAELPGMKKEEIDVSLHDGALSISGERKSEQRAENGGDSRSGGLVGR